MIVLLLACADAGTPPIEDLSEGATGPARLYLNELMADANAGGDWLEIYSDGAEGVDVGGYLLADETGEQSALADGTVVPAEGFLFVWCGDDRGDGEVWVTIRLDKDGDKVSLSHLDGDATVVDDAISWDSLNGMVAVARVPDGGPDWFYDGTPSPGASNI